MIDVIDILSPVNWYDLYKITLEFIFDKEVS